MGGRLCPVCGKGMYREKALKKHIRRYHPDYWDKYIRTGNFVMTSWCKGLRKHKLPLPPVCEQILRGEEHEEQ